MDLPGFDRFEFADGGTVKSVYRRGKGAGVILMHELPGMVPECVRLGEAIAEAGFTAYLPLFFGSPGQAPATRTSFLKVCLSREFTLWRRGVASPITDWLRALARRVSEESDSAKVGAIGLCLTGSFALAMLLEPVVAAPVVSEPALPLVLPFSPAAVRADLGLSPSQFDGARERSAREGIPVLGFRFQGDPICPKERFDTLRDAFGERFRATELAGDAHAVLTVDFRKLNSADRDRVWNALFGFLNERLNGGPGSIPAQPEPA
jgi:dienelactone hydrolase